MITETAILSARNLGGEVAVTHVGVIPDVAWLSPDQARTLARELTEAADDAEGHNT